MMTTPICDFVKEYSKNNFARMHMPGHKGKSFLGFEAFDITEINGADSLFDAKGIIAESEKNASEIFKCNTFYSTEGSSLCLRAMIYLLKLWDKNIKILAGRNAHKTFITAAALTDTDIEWLYPKEDQGYLSGKITAETIENVIKQNNGRKLAVYLTSPDYLGNIADIKAISLVCKKFGVLLCVDNAHGAYLKFMPESLHPIDLGADLCCDSAHKTLPVVTGGAYLHISPSAPEFFGSNAKSALSLFASTSPSYLILQSLDNANAYISNELPKKLLEFTNNMKIVRSKIIKMGYTLTGDELLKLVFKAKDFGYYGFELASILENNGIFCEFYDKDYLVLMLSSETTESEIEKTLEVLANIPQKRPIIEKVPEITNPERVVSLKEAIFSKTVTLPINQCLGKIAAEFNISCPPAVPILVCGERIDQKAIDCFEYYGIDNCKVIEV